MAVVLVIFVLPLQVLLVRVSDGFHQFPDHLFPWALVVLVWHYLSGIE